MNFGTLENVVQTDLDQVEGFLGHSLFELELLRLFHLQQHLGVEVLQLLLVGDVLVHVLVQNFVFFVERLEIVAQILQRFAQLFLRVAFELL